jgi:hypothetical protein
VIRQQADDAVQLLYIGNSADMAALRRSMEAHGAVTRSRLSPAVSAVVADPDIPVDHPTLQAARSLGVRVLEPLAAIESLTGTTDPTPSRSVPAQRSWVPVLVTIVVGLIAVLAALGVLGSVVEPAADPHPMWMEQVSPPVVAPGQLTGR